KKGNILILTERKNIVLTLLDFVLSAATIQRSIFRDVIHVTSGRKKVLLGIRSHPFCTMAPMGTNLSKWPHKIIFK
ncbi:hypothetical protein NPIL_23301, partial [Nephila pilipes]